MLVRVRDRVGARVRKATPFAEVSLLVNEVEMYLLKMDAISGLSGSLFSKSKQTRQQAGIFLTFITLVVVDSPHVVLRCATPTLPYFCTNNNAHRQSRDASCKAGPLCEVQRASVMGYNRQSLLAAEFDNVRSCIEQLERQAQMKRSRRQPRTRFQPRDAVNYSHSMAMHDEGKSSNGVNKKNGSTILIKPFLSSFFILFSFFF